MLHIDLASFDLTMSLMLDEIPQSFGVSESRVH